MHIDFHEFFIGLILIKPIQIGTINAISRTIH